MTFNELDTQLQGRNRNSRKLANNTYAQRKGDAIAIRLHATDILTFTPNGDVEVQTGGWHTSTTKERLNRYLPNGFGIYQNRNIWYWSNNVRFTDGDAIRNGELVTQAKPDSEKQDRKLLARIAKFAKLCGEAIPLARPSNGDCLYCNVLLRSQTGQPLGDSIQDTSHLESHMDEPYVVPSLVYSAMKEAGCGPAWYWSVFPDNQEQPITRDCFIESARTQVARCVRKYMRRRFGLAS